jgi:hypothetical protein
MALRGAVPVPPGVWARTGKLREKMRRITASGTSLMVL